MYVRTIIDFATNRCTDFIQRVFSQIFSVYMQNARTPFGTVLDSIIKYAIKNKFLLYALKLIDIIFSPYESCRPIRKINSESLKILIINSAHIGDVILSSYLLKLIKSKYPNSEIHFVLITQNK